MLISMELVFFPLCSLCLDVLLLLKQSCSSARPRFSSFLFKIVRHFFSASYSSSCVCCQYDFFLPDQVFSCTVACMLLLWPVLLSFLLVSASLGAFAWAMQQLTALQNSPCCKKPQMDFSGQESIWKICHLIFNFATCIRQIYTYSHLFLGILYNVQ